MFDNTNVYFAFLKLNRHTT